MSLTFAFLVKPPPRFVRLRGHAAAPDAAAMR